MKNEQEGAPMSADKRRNMLYGFAGVVIVLLAVIAYVSPRFRSEEASGAIGAVQKHRAPQIKQTDVVLGDESLKKEQKILYADFLTDAAALQSISADVAVAARSNEARSRFEAIASLVGTRVADLRQRYTLAARDYVSSLEAVARDVQDNEA